MKQSGHSYVQRNIALDQNGLAEIQTFPTWITLIRTVSKAEYFADHRMNLFPYLTPAMAALPLGKFAV